VTIARKEWTPIFMGGIPRQFVCVHCGLVQREHINAVYCPEWRLRQLDGDR